MIQQSTQSIGGLNCITVRDSNGQTPRAVVILCHGFGASGTDLVSIAAEFISRGGALADTVYLFPAGPIELDPLFDARAWWMIDIERIQQMMIDGQTREMQNESPEDLPERRSSLLQLIDHCRDEYSLPASKVIVGGFSQGSMLATDVALNYPERLGGLIVWSGALINVPVWTPLAKQRSALDIVQSHGRIDPILPITGAEDLRDMLTAAGHAVRFCEFNGEHAIPPQSLDLAAHLISEVASAPVQVD